MKLHNLGRAGHVALATCALLLNSLLLVGVASSPASAAGCYNYSCKGLNPSVQGCGADARTLEEFTDMWGTRIEMRYSPACYAVWTRISTPASDPYACETTPSGQIRGYKTTSSGSSLIGYYRRSCVPNGSGFTAMWPFGDSVLSCINYNSAMPLTGKCTGWH